MKRFFYRILSYFKRELGYFYVNEMKSQFIKCGDNVHIHSTCTVLVPSKMSIGSNSSISAYTTIFAGSGVIIGKDCLISSNCSISSVSHTQEAVIRYNDDPPEMTKSKLVVLGDNVWIGMNACILPGVEIGSNSIVGAGSVVTKNIPANQVWVGNPARFIKELSLKNI